MSADDLLAGPLDGIDVAHLAAEHRAACDELHRLRGQLHQRDVRADALAAACTWLAGVDPFPQGRRLVLESAAEFVAWIESGERP